MNPEVHVNIPDNFLNIEEFERKLPEAVMDAALEARNFWESEAGRRLTTSRQKYQEAIKLHQNADDSVSIMLEGSFANQIETGISSFSLRPGFLRSPSMKPGPVKMPRAVAASLPMTGQIRARRWMVVPLNVGRQAPFTSPTVFRTFTDTQPQSMWQHPGFKGVHIADEVQEQLNSYILEKHIRKLINKVLGG